MEFAQSTGDPTGSVVGAPSQRVLAIGDPVGLTYCVNAAPSHVRLVGSQELVDPAMNSNATGGLIEVVNPEGGGSSISSYPQALMSASRQCYVTASASSMLAMSHAPSVTSYLSSRADHGVLLPITFTSATQQHSGSGGGEGSTTSNFALPPFQCSSSVSSSVLGLTGSSNPSPMGGISQSCAMAPVRHASFVPEDGLVVATSITVSGIPPTFDIVKLKQLFAPFGSVRATRVVKKRLDGTGGSASTATGHLTFECEAAACQAQLAMNGATIVEHGTGAVFTLLVTAATIRDGELCLGGEETTKVFVRHIPRDSTLEEISAAFRRFGTVLQLTVHDDISARGKQEATSLKMGYVTFSSVEAALAAAREGNRRMYLPSSAPDMPLLIKLAETLACRRLRRNKATDGTPSPPTTSAPHRMECSSANGGGPPAMAPPLAFERGANNSSCGTPWHQTIPSAFQNQPFHHYGHLSPSSQGLLSNSSNPPHVPAGSALAYAAQQPPTQFVTIADTNQSGVMFFQHHSAAGHPYGVPMVPATPSPRLFLVSQSPQGLVFGGQPPFMTY